MQSIEIKKKEKKRKTEALVFAIWVLPCIQAITVITEHERKDYGK